MVTLWDFAGGAAMEPPRPTRTMQGDESSSQAVVATAFNASGKLFCVARLDPKVRVYDRDGTDGKGKPGEAKATTTRGDSYLLDMTKTKGHVAAVCGAHWSSHIESRLITAGADGTVRVWDVDSGPKALMGLELACQLVLRVKNERAGTRVGVLGSAVSASASERVVAACTDGSVQLWDLKPGSVYGGRPDMATRPRAFTPSESASVRVAVSGDGVLVYVATPHVVAPGGADAGEPGAVIVWDARRMSAGPLTTVSVPGVRGVDVGAMANAKTDAFVVAAGKAGLFSFTRELKAVSFVATPAPCSSAPVWHHATNQVVVGCGDGMLRMAFHKAGGGASAAASASAAEQVAMRMRSQNAAVAASSGSSGPGGTSQAQRRKDKDAEAYFRVSPAEPLPPPMLLSGADAFRQRVVDGGDDDGDGEGGGGRGGKKTKKKQ